MKKLKEKLIEIREDINKMPKGFQERGNLQISFYLRPRSV